MSTTSTSTSPPLASSPPPSLSSPKTTMTNIHSHHSSSQSKSPIYPYLPSPQAQRDITSARTAIVASLSNLVDTSLTPRATILHKNAAALDKQEKDVLSATKGLKRERERLQKEANGAGRKIKELGNVQNWAEVLERDFLVLEETLRLADGGSESGCSCSDCGDEMSVKDRGGDDKRPRDSRNDGRKGNGKDSINNKERHVMALIEHTAWSDTSHSLNEPESSTGTSMAKGSETASVSTTL